MGNAGFWFAGVGLETVYLASLATNWRFQRWVNAQARMESSDDDRGDAARRSSSSLDKPDKLALERLAAKCRRIESLWRAQDDVVLQSNEQALRDLQWVYLKLLLARQHVMSSESEANEAEVGADIQTLERELDRFALVRCEPRESKSVTLNAAEAPRGERRPTPADA